jgi:hypothetical protein
MDLSLVKYSKKGNPYVESIVKNGPLAGKINHRPITIKHCAKCGKQYVARKSKDRKNIYCSLICASQSTSPTRNHPNQKGDKNYYWKGGKVICNQEL